MYRILITSVVVGLAVSAAQAAERKGGVAVGRHGGPSGGRSVGSHPGTGHGGPKGGPGFRWPAKAPPTAVAHATPRPVVKDYHLHHGRKFQHGYYYKGQHHRHWTQSCWLPKYGCHCHWCPCTCVWYYWCVPDECYYPIDYCPYGSYVW